MEDRDAANSRNLLEGLSVSVRLSVDGVGP